MLIDWKSWKLKTLQFVKWGRYVAGFQSSQSDICSCLLTSALVTAAVKELLNCKFGNLFLDSSLNSLTGLQNLTFILPSV